MNVSCGPAPVLSWPHRVEEAVLFDTLLDRTAALQDSRQFDNGPVTIYGRGLNVTLSADRDSAVHVVGTLHGQAVDVTAGPARVQGTYAGETVAGTPDAIDMGGAQVASADLATPPPGPLDDLIAAMRAKGYQNMSATHGTVQVDDTTIPLDRIVFTGDGLPTVYELQVGGSRGEVTVTTTQTRTGPQSRYIGQFDGHTINFVEQSRCPGRHP